MMKLSSGDLSVRRYGVEGFDDESPTPGWSEVAGLKEQKIRSYWCNTNLCNDISSMCISFLNSYTSKRTITYSDLHSTAVYTA